MNETIFDKLRNMLKAYYPVFYLTSFEYDRTKQKLRGIAKTFDKCNLYEWNCVSGLRLLKDGNYNTIGDYEEPEELLKYIYENDDNSQKDIFILEDFNEFIEERNVKYYLRSVAEKARFTNTHIVIVSAVYKLPLELEKYVTVINVPLPDRDDLVRTLNQIEKDKKATLPITLKNKLVDAALGMTTIEADLAFCLSAVKDNFDVNSPITVASEKEQIIKKSGMLEYIQQNETLKDIGGMDILKDWLNKRQLAYDINAKSWGLSEPKGLLLLGVPGCGKSLTAKCISSTWNMPLLRLDMGKVFQGIVGSSEDNMRKAISTAEAVAPCVLWIDEIEKGLSGTKSSGSSDGGVTSRVFSTILTWMQEKTKPVFVVATANDIQQLPPELLRKGRFDEIFFVDLPSEEERRNIFKIHLEKKNKPSVDFALEKIAKESDGFNGAEIEECVKEAMFTAYIENPETPKLNTKHIIDSIKNTVPLSKTMKDEIGFLRKWASTRAKFASVRNPEITEKTEDLLLTKVEKERNRNFE
jgi:ATP-dependent 26S proteasome regulatory subunit